MRETHFAVVLHHWVWLPLGLPIRILLRFGTFYIGLFSDAIRVFKLILIFGVWLLNLEPQHISFAIWTCFSHIVVSFSQSGIWSVISTILNKAKLSSTPRPDEFRTPSGYTLTISVHITTPTLPFLFYSYGLNRQTLNTCTGNPECFFTSTPPWVILLPPQAFRGSHDTGPSSTGSVSGRGAVSCCTPVFGCHPPHTFEANSLHSTFTMVCSADLGLETATLFGMAGLFTDLDIRLSCVTFKGHHTLWFGHENHPGYGLTFTHTVLLHPNYSKTHACCHMAHNETSFLQHFLLRGF